MIGHLALKCHMARFARDEHRHRRAERRAERENGGAR